MNYYEIGTKSTIAKELYDYAFNPQPWFPHYNFNVKPIPPTWAEGLPIACEAKYGESYGDC